MDPIAHGLLAASPGLEELAAILLSPAARVGAFVWGLLWGSFANVLIYRLANDLSIVTPRSRCPRCETPIAFYDNIPVVSYLVLRGQCRHCGEPIKLRYLVVELVVGMFSFALYMVHVHVPLVAGGEVGWLQLAAWQLWFAYAVALLVVTYTDLDQVIIPDAVVKPMTVVGVAVAVVDPAILGIGVVEAGGAAAGGYIAFALIGWYYRKFRGVEGLGLGDAKLLMMVGAMTGVRGLLFCVAAGAVQGVLVSVPLLRSGRRVGNISIREAHGDDPELPDDDPDGPLLSRGVPFGPFLALAAMEYLLLRGQIDAWADALLFS